MDAITLGLRIRQARETKGLSQDDLALEMGKDQRAISEYERGDRRVIATDIPLFAQILDVSTEYFFKDVDENQELIDRILQQFHRLPDRRTQEAAIDLIRVFSDVLQPSEGSTSS